jgi:hypothetical protein
VRARLGDRAAALEVEKQQHRQLGEARGAARDRDPGARWGGHSS